ncbi:MAG: sigma-54 dependent transcriptional regulator, partial [Bacteroidales bacterium]|nr:sigma-54 dependent transcriptional regulator [Bacteroidales bacterium]
NLNNRLKEIEQNYSLVSKELQERIGHNLIGNTPVMNSIIELMSKVAKVDNTTVLITGESGTGKELVARGIHYLSTRKKQFFHSVNCSAIPETLFESEFFGHKKGSFTGAIENKIGWFEIANNGTLFLDEISDMPQNQQAKLLRVIEERKISKLGSHNEINVDIRVIAASNQDIEKMSQKKEFRLDLYHRLSSFIIHIPPLRERKDDIPLLVSHFIKDFSLKMGKPILHVDKNILKELMYYDFPGNVRELKNMAERAVILCDNNILKLKDFHIIKPINNASKLLSEDINEVFDLEVSEKKLIIKALKNTNYNKSKAADLLNISWQSLDRRMKKFNLS